jgi:hypothetical protein
VFIRESTAAPSGYFPTGIVAVTVAPAEPERVAAVTGPVSESEAIPSAANAIVAVTSLGRAIEVLMP